MSMHDVENAWASQLILPLIPSIQQQSGAIDRSALSVYAKSKKVLHNAQNWLNFEILQLYR